MDRNTYESTLHQLTGVNSTELIHQDTLEKLMTIKREVQANPNVPCIFERDQSTEQPARLILMSYQQCLYPEEKEVWKKIWNLLVLDENNPGDNHTLVQKFLSVLTRS